MKILGLRNLKSLGLIPVKRPYIKFDIDSIKSPSEKAQILDKKYIKTEPLERGSNANILTAIKLVYHLLLPYHIIYYIVWK